MTSKTTTTQLDRWLIHGDTHALPQEDIPHGIVSPHSGASYGWPAQMLGDETSKMLHGQQITKTSQCIQLAVCMTPEQFKALMGGGRPNGQYLIRTVESVPANNEEYQQRKRRWDADQCVINNRILEEWLLPSLGPGDTVHVGGRPRNQMQLVREAIAENKARLAAL